MELLLVVPTNQGLELRWIIIIAPVSQGGWYRMLLFNKNPGKNFKRPDKAQVAILEGI
jgi:hypothetical protein